MKILIAAASAPMQVNGVSRHSAKLAAALLLSNSVTELHFVAGSWQSEAFRRTFERADSRFHAHFVSPCGSRLSHMRWYYSELPLIAAQLGVDLVHFGNCVPLRAGAFRCGTVVTLHDLYAFDGREDGGRFKGLLTRRIMAQCLHRADAIACISQSCRSRLEAWFPKEAHKAAIIPNIVEPDRCLHADAPPFTSQGRELLLCVAQGGREKNLTLALRIFEQLIQGQIIPGNMQLVIIGNPRPTPETVQREIRRLKLESNVTFCNGLSDAQLQWCYRHCKLLLAPAITDAFALPLAEALTAGCPVVCPDMPAYREVGGEMCHYVTAGEGVMDRYAHTVREVLALPRPDPLTMPNLSSRSIAQKHVDLYARLTCRGVSISGMLRQPQHEQVV